MERQALAQDVLELDLVETDSGWKRLGDSKQLEALARQAISRALSRSKAEISAPCEVALVLSNDKEQRALNKKWRSQDKTTNVLSFAQLEPFSPLAGLLGDIVLARQTVASEAQSQQKSFEHHFVHLVVHGFLHILGYDHLSDEQASEMESLETLILADLGVPDPYGNENGDLAPNSNGEKQP